MRPYRNAAPLSRRPAVDVFYWDNLPGRRLRPDLVTSEVALEQAQSVGEGRAVRSIRLHEVNQTGAALFAGLLSPPVRPRKAEVDLIDPAFKMQAPDLAAFRPGAEQAFIDPIIGRSVQSSSGVWYRVLSQRR